MFIKRAFILFYLLILLIAFTQTLNNYNSATQSNSSLPTTPIPISSVSVPILVYHYVEHVKDEKDTIRKSLNTTPYLFIKQIETLKIAGYTFITALELMDIMDAKINAPSKPVVITFDDGYRDFYTDVFPILKQYNIKAVAYIVSGFLDKSNYMFTWQLKEIARSGLVEIGAHTVNHASLKNLPFEIAKYEIEESKKTLERLIGSPVVSFAYPNGSFDENAIKLVREAGFRSATTTEQGFEINHDNKYSAYRIHPGNKVDNFLLNFLEQK